MSERKYVRLREKMSLTVQQYTLSVDDFTVNQKWTVEIVSIPLVKSMHESQAIHISDGIKNGKLGSSDNDRFLLVK